MGGRGTWRIYLGAAPGVGKTYAMLNEGRRRAERGTDVVVGFAETHGRSRTAEQLGGLEVVPPRRTSHGGTWSAEMDVDAVLARRPEVALVDELAHANGPGCRNARRWEDIEELLQAGIDVVSTLNIQHLASLNDVVESITGVRHGETVPDAVVRRADQIELVDMTAEALRRRLAHGNVHAADQAGDAPPGYFRTGNLNALRELALLWVADRVDEGLARYRDQHGITEPWEARERIVVALSGGPEGDALIRRAARMGARAGRADLLAVRVVRSDGLAEGSPAATARQRALVESIDGTFHQVVGDDVAVALVEFARAVDATQLVLGSGRRAGRRRLSGGGVEAAVTREPSGFDVHIVAHEHAGDGRGAVRRSGSALSRRRRGAGWALAVAGPPLLTALLAGTGLQFGLVTDILFYLALTVGVALAGGLWPAVAAAVLGSLLANWFFTPPFHTLTIAGRDNAIALAIFIGVAAAVASVVDLAARRSRQAARSGAEAETLSMLATSVLRGEKALPALLERVRETFGVSSVALLERTGDGWRTLGSTGPEPCSDPDEADVRAAVAPERGGETVLALRGRVLPAADRRVLSAFASQAAAALEWRRLAEEAAGARRLAEGNRIRTALLAAVSHDLRTPLASIKAGVSSLRQTDVDWDPEDEAELLATIEESADKLDGLIGNLLDMSRLQTGAVSPLTQPVPVEQVVPPALQGVPAGRVEVDVPETLPPVLADPGLLERALANVVENAVRHSTGAVTLSACALRGGLPREEVEIRVADRGPGVPEAAREQIFAPFQRLGDSPRGDGVGLGLAVARGFTEAMGGTLQAEDTPGGGLTMVFTLPAGAAGDSASRDEGRRPL
ncbi:ATP-binding protein [Actinomadura sp. WMMA1423]|uniref:sensor histidine kinase n=1 Tax=Actinomadura sp. WMMA1423 TaxID=2591108 RepID=UPI001146C22A|nr:ATP-binding protein [Actinomadura sp. WMMA1423]